MVLGMQRVAAVLFVVCMGMVLPGCGGGGDSPPPPSGDGPKSVQPVSFPMNIAPVVPPKYQCGDPSIRTQAAIQKLNSFWGSKVSLCACEKDLENNCQENAMVFDPRLPVVVPGSKGFGYGYIYYDANWFQELDSSTKSNLPADMVLAHEFGHNVQIERDDNSFLRPFKIGELTADCLAGFYVGYQIQSEQVKEEDINQTFDLACENGDQRSSLWFERGAHGTCGERRSALGKGINGFRNGLQPGQACPRF